MPLLPLVIALSERAESLQTRLIEREKQIASMKAILLLLSEQAQRSNADYATLSEALRLAEESRVILAKELTATSVLLKTSQTDYVALSTSYDDYRSEVAAQADDLRKERNAAQLQARIWRVVAIGGLTLAVGGAVAIVVILVK